MGAERNANDTFTISTNVGGNLSLNAGGILVGNSVASTTNITRSIGNITLGGVNVGADSINLTVTAPVVQISSTLQSLTTNANGQYVAVITVTNLGNITASPAVSSATLGAAAAVTPLPTIPNVAPNQTVTVSLTTNLPLMTPLIGRLFTNGVYTFVASATFKNEPFDPSNTN